MRRPERVRTLTFPAVLKVKSRPQTYVTVGEIEWGGLSRPLKRFRVHPAFRASTFLYHFVHNPMSGGGHLAEHTAGHLGRQAMRGAYLVVERLVQALVIGGLPMGKGILACLIECIPIGQLCLSQRSKLLRSRS